MDIITKPAIVKGWQLPSITIIAFTHQSPVHSGSELRPSHLNDVGITPNKGREGDKGRDRREENEE